MINMTYHRFSSLSTLIYIPRRTITCYKPNILRIVYLKHSKQFICLSHLLIFKSKEFSLYVVHLSQRTFFSSVIRLKIERFLHLCSTENWDQAHEAAAGCLNAMINVISNVHFYFRNFTLKNYLLSLSSFMQLRRDIWTQK